MFKNFRLHIILRILLIVVLGYAMVYILTETHFWLVAFWIGLAIIILLAELIRYIERSHRDLENFLLAIRKVTSPVCFPACETKAKTMA
jgi:uncharacterized membrane protein YcaP (DUF421 family)